MARYADLIEELRQRNMIRYFKPLPEDELNEIARHCSYLPDDYLDFLREIGHGSLTFEEDGMPHQVMTIDPTVMYLDRQALYDDFEFQLEELDFPPDVPPEIDIWRWGNDHGGYGEVGFITSHDSRTNDCVLIAISKDHFTKLDMTFETFIRQQFSTHFQWHDDPVDEDD